MVAGKECRLAQPIGKHLPTVALQVNARGRGLPGIAHACLGLHALGQTPDKFVNLFRGHKTGRYLRKAGLNTICKTVLCIHKDRKEFADVKRMWHTKLSYCMPTSSQKSPGSRSNPLIAGSYEADFVKPPMRFCLSFSHRADFGT